MAKKKSKSSQHYQNDRFLLALGEHCRKIRVKQGYSVNRMAAEGDRLSPSVIMRLETGEGAVNVLSLMRFAQVLNIHPKKLLDFEFEVDE